MPVTDEQVAALRAFLQGDFDGHKQLYSDLRRRGARDEFAALMPAAFAIAVQRRFPAGAPPERVVEFVSEVRARHLSEPDEIDPVAAERLVRVVTSGESARDMHPDVKYRTQFLLLYPLVAEEKLSEQGLDDFLAG